MTVPILKAAYLATHHQRFPVDFIFEERVVDHYELVFFLGGSDCQMTLDGQTYRIKSGDIVFRKPGQTNSSYMPFESIQLQFDWQGEDLMDKIGPHYVSPCKLIYKDLFENIFRETLMKKPYSHLMFQAILLEIIYGILQEKDFDHDTLPRTSHPDLLSILAYIDNHLHHKLTVEDLAKSSALSRRKVFALFKSELGMTPTAYINELKLNYASELLISSNISVEEVAYRSGFQNHTYFITLFKKVKGRTPYVYRKALTNQLYKV